jgi:hypothetical protein
MTNRKLAAVDSPSTQRTQDAVRARVRAIPARSLFPLVALALIAGTALWGPWVTLALVALWWTLVTRYA